MFESLKSLAKGASTEKKEIVVREKSYFLSGAELSFSADVCEKLRHIFESKLRDSQCVRLAGVFAVKTDNYYFFLKVRSGCEEYLWTTPFTLIGPDDYKGCSSWTDISITSRELIPAGEYILYDLSDYTVTEDLQVVGKE